MLLVAFIRVVKRADFTYSDFTTGGIRHLTLGHVERKVQAVYVAPAVHACEDKEVVAVRALRRHHPLDSPQPTTCKTTQRTKQLKKPIPVKRKIKLFSVFYKKINEQLTGMYF